MNASRCLLISLLMIGCAVLLSAQSPSPSNTSEQAASDIQLTSGTAPTPSPTVSIEPPSLIPPNILPGPGIGSLPRMPGMENLPELNALFKQTSLGKAADDARLRLEVAQLEVRIKNDEELHAARAAADKRKTDLEKRAALKAYYHLYYDKLRALTPPPEVKAYLDALEKAHFLVLLQPKVRHETDEAEAIRLVGGAAPAARALPTPFQARAPQAVVKP